MSLYQPSPLGHATLFAPTGSELLVTMGKPNPQNCQFLDLIALGVVAVDVDGVLRFANAHFLKSLGCLPGEITGRALSSLAEANSAAAVADLLCACRSGASSETEATFKVHDTAGTMRVRLSAAPLTGDDGAYAGALVAIIDRPQCGIGEDSDCGTAQTIREVLDSISDAFFALDQDMIVRYFNPAAERALGRRREDVLGKHLFDEAFPEAKGSVFEAMYRRALSDRRPVSFEVYFDRPPYENWYSVRVSPMRDGISVYFQVTTEQKRAQEDRERVQRRLLEVEREAKQKAEEELEKLREQLVRQTQLATIGQLSASIAHELRNPLGTVRNAAYLLRRALSDEHARLREYVTIIDQETAAADRIITELVAMSRGRAPQRAAVRVAALIAAARQRVDVPDEVAWHCQCAPEDLDVWADAAQIEQVLRNVLANAAQAIAGAGAILVQAAARGEDVEITVTDSGPGIAPEHRQRVFEPLFTTRPRGTGLGLAICRQIVERHGGTIDLLPNNPGAVFRIRLPRRVSTTASEEPAK